VVVIAGVESRELFDTNWKAFQDASALTEAETAEIADLRQRFDKVFCRRCDYCQPCAEDIPIQTVLGVRWLVKRMGKELFQSSFLWNAVEKARNCTACGDCLTRCPYDLPIPDMIAENLRWLEELNG
jgi:predicted aldo/keto reductase-like oxidoreductase